MSLVGIPIYLVSPGFSTTWALNTVGVPAFVASVISKPWSAVALFVTFRRTGRPGRTLKSITVTGGYHVFISPISTENSWASTSSSLNDKPTTEPVSKSPTSTPPAWSANAADAPDTTSTRPKTTPNIVLPMTYLLEEKRRDKIRNGEYLPPSPRSRSYALHVPNHSCHTHRHTTLIVSKSGLINSTPTKTEA